MEPFAINLSQTEEKGGRYRRYLIIIALIFIAFSVLSFAIFYKRSSSIEWIFLLGALYFAVFIYFAFVGYKSKIFINGDDHALEYQFGFFGKVPEKIIWQTCTKVKLGPTYLAFYKRTGKRKVMQLGWLPYSKVVEIKDKVQHICNEKGITVEIADYHKG